MDLVRRADADGSALAERQTDGSVLAECLTDGSVLAERRADADDSVLAGGWVQRLPRTATSHRREQDAEKDLEVAPGWMRS